MCSNFLVLCGKMPQRCGGCGSRRIMSDALSSGRIFGNEEVQINKNKYSFCPPVRNNCPSAEMGYEILALASESQNPPV